MIRHCRLKRLFKNYLKTVIVGFGQVDVLGLTLCDVVELVLIIFVVKSIWSNSNIVQAVVVEEHQEASLAASIG